ncbi:Histidinol-phosphate aminotransferase [Planctomycetes bacterium Pan216]|uniref:Histidinol-phosphate aminotransferase n=1 Tax=Kolteria novifilia TaxID=2527975 RepID=A0A518BBH0_9BACT|nr:Histidinol-phosphate aminotransferase [Planctomycetes bacterium Pan216]
MDYFREPIKTMKGYVPGFQPQGSGWTKLNTNENPYPPSPQVLEAIERTARDRLAIYPDPVANAFREAAGERFGVPAEWVVAFNGSDEALAVLTRCCLGEDDLLVVPFPSYTLYHTLAEIQGCRFEERPFTEDWKLPAGFTTGAKLAFVPNPNAPSGTCLTPKELLTVADQAPCPFVVDEAYGDFADASCIGKIAECERLVVTRTLSKSYSLAGLRFGFAIAQPVVANTLLKVKDSYNCDALSIAAATAAIKDVAYFETYRDRVLATRTRLQRGLDELGFSTIPSNTNFVWAQRDGSVKPIFDALLERKILVRYMAFPGYGEGLRVSVGRDDQIDHLLEELRRIV